jgi:hypothetical protein
MGYRGHIKNGAVEFEEPVALPEGAEVEVTPKVEGTGEKPVEDLAQVEGEIPTLHERFGHLIGIGNGLPKDMAENHDLYIHGAPKK